MIIKVSKLAKGFQAECLTFDENSPKEIKKIVQESNIPRLLIKLQDELIQHFNDRKMS